MPSYTAPTRDARFIINEMLDLAGRTGLLEPADDALGGIVRRR